MFKSKGLITIGNDALINNGTILTTYTENAWKSGFWAFKSKE